MRVTATDGLNSAAPILIPRLRCFPSPCPKPGLQCLVYPYFISFSPFQGGRNGVMRVTATDGLNSAAPVHFRFRVRDVSLHLVRNEALDVFPMMQTPLRQSSLLVVSSDWDPRREITYIVKRGPGHGRLLYRDLNSDLVSCSQCLHLLLIFLESLFMNVSKSVADL